MIIAMETAFVLGGFNLNTTATCDAYAPLRKRLAAKGYQVVAADISWRRKLPSQYLKEFMELYEANRTDRNIVIGNSFGAVIALLAASRIGADALYLCSLSPYFKEDKDRPPDAAHEVRIFGKRRLEELRSYSADELAAQITDTKVYVLYGEGEHKTCPPLVARCIETAAKIKGARLLEIPRAPHDMSDPIYTNALLDLMPPAS